MPHIFFLANYLFKMYEIHAQYNWMFPIHVIFPHNLHLHLRPYTSAKQGHACLPCTSSFPVHITMSSLHESRSHHLQTLSHAVHPSMAQKNENLMVLDQDYRRDGGAQSNQIWRLPTGFVDLSQGGHCHAESTCLLDSCKAALTSNAVSVFGGFWCMCPNWLSHLWPSHPPESLHQCPKRWWSYPFWQKELSWTSFFLVIVDDAVMNTLRDCLRVLN